MFLLHVISTDSAFSKGRDYFLIKGEVQDNNGAMHKLRGTNLFQYSLDGNSTFYVNTREEAIARRNAIEEEIDGIGTDEQYVHLELLNIVIEGMK